MKFPRGWAATSSAPEHQSIDGGMTKSTVSSSRKSSGSSSRQHSRSSGESRNTPPSSRRSGSSARESSRSARLSHSTSSSRGRSTERRQDSSSSSRRSTSSQRRDATKSLDASRDSSSRGRPRASSMDHQASSPRGRTSSMDHEGSTRGRSSSHTPTSSRRRSASASSRRSASASRGQSTSRPPLPMTPRQAKNMSTSRNDLEPPSVSSRHSSRNREDDIHSPGGTSASGLSKFVFRRSNKSPGSVASSRDASSRDASTHESSRGSKSSEKSSRKSRRKKKNSKDSRSEPLLGNEVKIETNERGYRGRQGMSITTEADIENGTFDESYTLGSYTLANGEVVKSTPLTNPEQMVNGLLIQLKFESEVCPWPLRVMLVLCAIGIIVTSFLPYWWLGQSFSVADIILSTITTCLSIFIILLEGRFSGVSNDPVGCRASVRGAMVKSVGGLKLVWGRGILYTVTGLLQVAQMHTLTYISGALMTVVGIVVIIAGASSAAQLMRLKRSLTDDAHLLYLFAKFDSDKDGYQVIKDFARFIVAVGLDLDDAYTLGAFRAVDKDKDGRISFIDFHKWWSQCTVKGNHVFQMKEQEISNFSSTGAGLGSW